MMGSCRSNYGDSAHQSEHEQRFDPKIHYQRDERDLIEEILKREPQDLKLDRLLGCAYGQALGDAVGLATEFETRQTVAAMYPDPRQIIPFPRHTLTHHSKRWERGDWTDDTDQWILVLETLIDYQGDPRVFAKKLKHWIQHGFHELGDHAGMGLGANVNQVVNSPQYLNDPIRSSHAVWEQGQRQAAPNGAVMRCSASAFAHSNDIDRVKQTAVTICQTTHADPRCIASCLAVCLTVASLIETPVHTSDIEHLIRSVQQETIKTLGQHLSESSQQEFLWYTDAHRTLEELQLDEVNRIGYTYKCLAAGFYGLRSKKSFEETLNDLIRYGGDADTNGAVCGTMYGARYGYRALPNAWLRAMPFKKWFDEKIIACLRKMNFRL